MSDISEFNGMANAEIDHEHEVQLGLLQALILAAKERRTAEVGPLLEQLTSYSEAHFMSEELLMRLKSYDEFEDHVDDHWNMLEALRGIARDHDTGNSLLVEGKAQAVLSFIGQHIATRDMRFAAFVRNGQ